MATNQVTRRQKPTGAGGNSQATEQVQEAEPGHNGAVSQSTFSDGLGPTILQVQRTSESIIEQLADDDARPGIAATAYDTAWVASIANSNGSEAVSPQFPGALKWIEENQWSDGSWGGAVRYEHDRVLCTLAALASLRQYDHDGRYGEAIQRGIRYLWQHGHLLSSEPTELVAFELLLPTMVRRAQDQGIHVPPHLDIYSTERVEKLRLIPTGALYSPRVTIVHSLEFLGAQADQAGLRAAQGENGSIGNSPAATAFYFSASRDPQALSYLEKCLSRNGTQQPPVLYPCETYELLWSAYHLYLAGVPVQRMLCRSNRAALQLALRTGGVSLSSTFPIPDADDTSVALLFLRELGDSPDPRVLQTFALEEGHFASFPYERNSSVGVSLHVLHALLRVPGYPDSERAIDRLLDYLTSQQISGLYWLDKWHISPYYATAHALCVLRQLTRSRAARMRPLIERARQWLKETQNADGSWGFYGQPTVEETSYGLLALTAGAPDRLSEEELRSASAAASYIRTALEQGEFTPDGEMVPLWIDKCLYAPIMIVQAAVEAALEAYRQVAASQVDKGNDR